MDKNADPSNVAVTIAVPRAGSLKNLFARVATAPSGSGDLAKQSVLTVWQNGAPTALQCAIAGAALTCSNTGSTIPVSQGDTITVQVTKVGSSPAPASSAWRFSLEFA